MALRRFPRAAFLLSVAFLALPRSLPAMSSSGAPAASGGALPSALREADRRRRAAELIDRTVRRVHAIRVKAGTAGGRAEGGSGGGGERVRRAWRLKKERAREGEGEERREGTTDAQPTRVVRCRAGRAAERESGAEKGGKERKMERERERKRERERGRERGRERRETSVGFFFSSPLLFFFFRCSSSPFLPPSRSFCPASCTSERLRFVAQRAHTRRAQRRCCR